MLWIFIFVISALISSGSGGASHASSFMHGQKPILRMGLDEEDDDPEHKELLKVPNWVSNLRYAINEEVTKLGLRNAGAKIKQIISDVADDVKDIGLQGNDEPDALEYSEKKGLRTLAVADEHRNPDKPEITGDPLWMVDLKSYVRDLVATKGRNDLEGFVRPVIDSVEKNNHIKIKDIDGKFLVLHADELSISLLGLGYNSSESKTKRLDSYEMYVYGCLEEIASKR